MASTVGDESLLIYVSLHEMASENTLTNSDFLKLLSHFTVEL